MKAIFVSFFKLKKIKYAYKNQTHLDDKNSSAEEKTHITSIVTNAFQMPCWWWSSSKHLLKWQIFFNKAAPELHHSRLCSVLLVKYSKRQPFINSKLMRKCSSRKSNRIQSARSKGTCTHVSSDNTPSPPRPPPKKGPCAPPLTAVVSYPHRCSSAGWDGSRRDSDRCGRSGCSHILRDHKCSCLAYIHLSLLQGREHTTY